MGIVAIGVNLSWAWVAESTAGKQHDIPLLYFFTKRAAWKYWLAENFGVIPTGELLAGFEEFYAEFEEFYAEFEEFYAESEEYSDAIEGLEVWGIFERETDEAINDLTGDIWAEIGEPEDNETGLYEDDGADSTDSAGVESAPEDAFGVGVADAIEEADADDDGSDTGGAADSTVFEVWSYDSGYGFDDSDDSI